MASRLRILALLGLAAAQWTRRVELSLPTGVTSIIFEEADDPDAIAARFVREHGMTDGAGCTADAACVAARVAGALRAELARPMTTDAALRRAGKRIVSTVRGQLMLTLENDLAVSASLAAIGTWEEPAIALLLALARAGDIVVDVGANIGAHALPLAAAVAPAGCDASAPLGAWGL